VEKLSMFEEFEEVSTGFESVGGLRASEIIVLVY
jgi:hypothetical protein